MFHDTNTLLLFALHHRADIINRGFGGYNTRMGVYLVDEILASFGAGRVRLVTIGFGANDANLRDGSNAVSVGGRRGGREREGAGRGRFREGRCREGRCRERRWGGERSWYVRKWAGGRWGHGSLVTVGADEAGRTAPTR